MEPSATEVFCSTKGNPHLPSASAHRVVTLSWRSSPSPQLMRPGTPQSGQSQSCLAFWIVDSAQELVFVPLMQGSHLQQDSMQIVSTRWNQLTVIVLSLSLWLNHSQHDGFSAASLRLLTTFLMSLSAIAASVHCTRIWSGCTHLFCIKSDCIHGPSDQLPNLYT